MHIQIRTADGIALAATWFTARAPLRAVAVIASATAVPRGFYRRFAAWLAEHGVAALTFDYRGMGGSPAPVDRPATMADWGRHDMAAAHREARRRAPGVPLVHVGQSVGGQLLGLLPERTAVDRALLFNCSTGWWWGLSGRTRWLAGGLFHVWMPLLAPILGYAPMRPFGYGMDLPGGVALQWARWCRQRAYLRRDLAGPLKDARFDEVRFPILAVRSSDDPIATAGNFEDLLTLYAQAPVTRRVVTPEELGLRRLGHLDLLRPSAQALWPDWLGWILARPQVRARALPPG